MHSILWLVVLISACDVFLTDKTYAARLQEKYVWKQIAFAWPSDGEEQNAIATGRYIPENNAPLSMDLWGDKVFITIPRWKSGVAASLAYIQLPDDSRSPILHPYPNWESHDMERNFPEVPQVQKRAANFKCSQLGNFLSDGPEPKTVELSTNIVSPYRAKADECDRLWVLDWGRERLLEKTRRQVTLPTIILFDLNTDKVLHRYTFPQDQVLKTSEFVNFAVDISDHECGNAFIYVADVVGYGMLVYSLNEDRSWRIKHNYFHFDPLEGNFFIGGINFQVPDGIFGLAVGNQKPDKSKNVYFHALSSTKEFVVSNKVLQNETRALDKDSYYDFKMLGDRGFNGQSNVQIFDKNTEIIFYSQVNKDAVGCWNSRKPYTPDTQGLVDSDSVTLVFVNEFFVDKGDNLWVLSNKLPQVLFTSGLNASEDNFRILGGRISELIIGTPCDFVDDSFYLQYPDL